MAKAIPIYYKLFLQYMQDISFAKFDFFRNFAPNYPSRSAISAFSHDILRSYGALLTQLSLKAYSSCLNKARHHAIDIIRRIYLILFSVFEKTYCILKLIVVIICQLIEADLLCLIRKLHLMIRLYAYAMIIF